MVSFNVNMLEKVMIGLVVIFAIITFFGSVASDINVAIENVTGSGLQGVAIFGIVGLLVTLGLLVALMRGLFGGAKR